MLHSLVKVRVRGLFVTSTFIQIANSTLSSERYPSASVYLRSAPVACLTMAFRSARFTSLYDLSFTPIRLADPSSNLLVSQYLLVTRSFYCLRTPCQWGSPWHIFPIATPIKTSQAVPKGACVPDVGHLAPTATPQDITTPNSPSSDSLHSPPGSQLTAGIGTTPSSSTSDSMTMSAGCEDIRCVLYDQCGKCGALQKYYDYVAQRSSHRCITTGLGVILINPHPTIASVMGE